jgi:hypothetical protein
VGFKLQLWSRCKIMIDNRIFGSLFAVVLFVAIACHAQAQSSNSNVDALQLRITIVTPTVKQGDPVEILVEIKNNGKYEVSVARWLLCTTNGPSCLSLEFEDEDGLKHEGEAMHAIMSPDATNEWWTQLSPSHYYGVEERLEGLPYDFLKKPGRYRVTARYVSKGGLTPPSREDWHIPAREVWKGDIVSNVGSFEVVAKGK